MNGRDGTWIHRSIELASFLCMLLLPLLRYFWNRSHQNTPHWVHGKVFSDAGHGYLLPSLLVLMFSPIVSALGQGNLVEYVDGHSLSLAGGLAVYYILREVTH